MQNQPYFCIGNTALASKMSYIVEEFEGFDAFGRPIYSTDYSNYIPDDLADRIEDITEVPEVIDDQALEPVHEPVQDEAAGQHEDEALVGSIFDGFPEDNPRSEAEEQAEEQVALHEAQTTIHDDPMDLPTPLSPPPTRTFSTRAAGLQFIANWSLRRRYGTYVKRSNRGGKNGRGPVNRVYINCDRGGKYEDRVAPNHRQRFKNNTKKTGCKFRLVLRLTQSVWRLEVKEPSHNHEPSSNAACHPQHRKKALDRYEAMIKSHLESGLTAAQSMTILHDSMRLDDLVHCYFTLQDLYNIRKKLRYSTGRVKSTFERVDREIATQAQESRPQGSRPQARPRGRPPGTGHGRAIRNNPVPQPYYSYRAAGEGGGAFIDFRY
ncbi:hypothetical protein VTO42DRAFT_3192 [Malbranchea cinnamomea]